MGIDRIDQRALPLSNSYTYTATGAGVQVYIIDSGIRTDHVDFGGRATVGADFVGDGQNGIDCNGHGTHVAGTIGGQVYGVAKGAKFHRRPDARLCGQLELVAGHRGRRLRDRPKAGTPEYTDGRQHEHPGLTGRRDRRGRGQFHLGRGQLRGRRRQRRPVRRGCLQLDAGSGARSDDGRRDNQLGCAGLLLQLRVVRRLVRAGRQHHLRWISSTTSTAVKSGTSMAAPATAGVAALYLQDHPTEAPQDVRDALFQATTKGIVGSANSTNDDLLYSLFAAAPPVLTTISVAPASASVAAGGQQQFSATGRDQYGQPIAATYGWSVSGGGTIDPTGLFHAGSTAGGPYSVTAASGTVSGTASVSVTAAPPVLTTISVAPASASVAAGGQQQFTASGRDQYGQPIAATYGWSVSAAAGRSTRPGCSTPARPPAARTA